MNVESRDNRNWSQPIHAVDGGYFLASFNSASPPDEDEDWIPTVYPENPGDVLGDGPVANINILNDVDERVLLSCILLNRTPTEREVQSRIDQGDHLATFALNAVGPIHVISNDLEDQVTLAPWLATPIRLGCFVSMRIEKPALVEPGEPAEQHHLRMWPADGVLRVTPWWM